MLRPGENIVPLKSQAAETFGAEHRSELLTILFTDQVNSTQLQNELGNREASRLTDLQRAMVHEELAKYAARAIEWAGDSCLAVFAKPSDAVLFSLKLQSALRRVRKDEPRMAQLRIGLHVGEIIVRHHGDASNKEDLFGLQVSETARVMSLARADQIYCTRAVFDSARSVLKSESIDGISTVMWKNYGLFELKGSDEPAEICEVGEEGLAPLLPPEPNEKCTPIKGDIERWRKRRARRTRPIAYTVRRVFTVGIVGLLAGVFLGRYTFRPVTDQSASRGATAPENAARITRFALRLPAGFAARQSFPVTISPDGSMIAFAGDGVRTIGGSLFVRSLNNFDDTTTKIPGTEGAYSVCFSPDGQWLAYNQSERIVKYQLSTGTTEIIKTGVAVTLRNGAWGSDGSIVIADEDGLHVLPPQGGEFTLITHVDKSRGEIFHSTPSWVPGKNAILYTIWMQDEAHSQIAVVSLDSGESKVLHTGGSNPKYSPTGHLIFGLSGKIWAVPFDLNRVEINGRPQAVIDGVAIAASTYPFHFSKDGTLVYVAGVATASSRELIWITGNGERVPLNLSEAQFYFPSISPDGQRLAVSIGARGLGRVWLYDLQRAAGFPLTAEPGSSLMPVWSPTGDRIAFRSERGLFLVKPEPGAQPMQILKTLGTAFLSSWSPDGTELVYTQSIPQGLAIMAVRVTDANPVPRTLVQVNGDASLGRISPDGRWLAYTANVSGKQEIWVQSYPDSGVVKPFLVSNQGSRDSVWSRDGKSLYFLNNENTAIFKVSTDEEFSKWGLPEKVCDLDPLIMIPALNVSSYDVAPDGRFLFPRDVTPQSPLEIRVVLNWFEELKTRVPVTVNK